MTTKEDVQILLDKIEAVKGLTTATEEYSAAQRGSAGAAAQENAAMEGLSNVSDLALGKMKDLTAEGVKATAIWTGLGAVIGAIPGVLARNPQLIKHGALAGATFAGSLAGTGAIGAAKIAASFGSKAFQYGLELFGKYLGLIIKLPLKIYFGAFKAMYDITLKVGEKLFEINKDFLKLMDDQTASFFKQTQASKIYLNTLDKSIDALRNQGLAIGQVGESAAALYNNTVLFRDASESTRKELLTFTSVLDQAGVAASDTSRIIQILNKTYGDTGKETMVATRRIIDFARAVGISGQQAAADFGNASTVIAAHGEHMEEVFKELLIQSRGTGLEMQDLLSIAAQFDTFEDSASAVGRLNAMLGGPYLNSIEMVYATESERNRAVLEAFEMSGKTWESMHRLERRAYASAAGIEDMGKATEFFGGGLAVFDKAAAQADANRDKQEALAEVAKRATNLFDNFKNTLMAFAVSLRGPIEFVRKLFGHVAMLNEASGGAIGRVGLLVGVMAKATSAFGPMGFAGSLLLLKKLKDEGILQNFLGQDGMKLLDDMQSKALTLVMQLPKLLGVAFREVMKLWTEMTKTPEWAQFKLSFMVGLAQLYRDIQPAIKEIMFGIVMPIAADMFEIMGESLSKAGGIPGMLGGVMSDIGGALRAGGVGTPLTVEASEAGVKEAEKRLKRAEEYLRTAKSTPDREDPSKWLFESSRLEAKEKVERLQREKVAATEAKERAERHHVELIRTLRQLGLGG